jgi:rubrerythrin
MDLGTFGAILSHAIEMEGQAVDFYRQAAQVQGIRLFEELAEGSEKRRRRLLRARQELVSEMILESITGLRSEDYSVELEPQALVACLQTQSRALEEMTARFYRDAAAKMPIREVVRLLERLARESDRRADRIAEHPPQ